VPLGLGVWEMVILFAVLALLFGVKGLPDVAKRLGTGVREVKDAVGEVDPRRMLDAGDTPERRPPPREPAPRDEA
jgi:TatA/E family protein of Tat protein translocase